MSIKHVPCMSVLFYLKAYLPACLPAQLPNRPTGLHLHLVFTICCMQCTYGSKATPYVCLLPALNTLSLSRLCILAATPL